MSKSLPIAFLAATLTLACCNRDAVFDSYVAIPRETWSADNLASFNIAIPDTSQSYDIMINLRNSTDYPFQNLFLFISIYSPNGGFVRDTFECFLADDNGRWTGRGSGRIHDNRFIYREGVKFYQPGSYRFDLQQAMRVEDLRGVVDVGIRIEQSQQNFK